MSSATAPKTVTPLKQAFLALEDAEARLAAKLYADREPIAVVGMGCRVPGGGEDPASFWRLMHEGVDAIAPVPADRWDHDALYDPTLQHRVPVTRSGGFLRAIDTFDAALFGIALPRGGGMDHSSACCWKWPGSTRTRARHRTGSRSATGVYVRNAAVTPISRSNRATRIAGRALHIGDRARRLQRAALFSAWASRAESDNRYRVLISLVAVHLPPVQAREMAIAASRLQAA